MVLFDAASRKALLRKDSEYHRPLVLEADGQGFLWGGSADGRSIFKYDRELEVCDSAILARPARFRCGCRDRQGRIWFGTEQGIVALDPATGRPATDARLLRCLAHAAGFNVTVLTPADDGTVYIGTQGDNLHAIDLSNHTFDRNIVNRFYKLNYTSDFSCGFCDREGNVWIGTADRGYYVRFTYKKNFTQMPRLGKQTLGKFINAITVGDNGTLWIGSHYKGLLGYNNREYAARWHTTENSPLMQQLQSNGITALHYDSSDRLWVNIDDRIAVCTTEQVAIRSHTLLPERLLVNRFCEDARQRVWAATRSGLALWEGTRLQKIRFRDCDVQDVALLDDTTILAAVSGEGIRAVDIRTLDARPCIETSDSLIASALRRPTCLYCGKDGSLWIGTRSGGLLRYHPQQGFRSYTLRDGFASNEIAAVTQDPQGNTWVATSYGLALITASTERVITYFQTDRLQTQQFYPHCSLNTMSMIYFGGNTGLAQFAPGASSPRSRNRRAAGADRNPDQQRRPAPCGRRNPHPDTERHRAYRPQPQAAEHRHRLRGRDVPLAGERPLRLPPLRRRHRRGVELRREPTQRQLRTPARRTLHLRTESPEPRRILERGASAAGNRHQTLAAADVVRLSALHRRSGRGRLVRQPPLPAPPAAEDGTAAGPARNWSAKRS